MPSHQSTSFCSKNLSILYNVSFPFSLYWRQLFSSHLYVKFINPFSFWHRYKIDRPETCWELDPVRFLERCYRLNWQLTQDTASIGIYRDRGVPWEKIPQNTVLISQPNWKLKYRGVTYCASGIVAVNSNKFTSNISQITTNNSEKLSTANNSANS